MFTGRWFHRGNLPFASRRDARVIVPRALGSGQARIDGQAYAVLYVFDSAETLQDMPYAFAFRTLADGCGAILALEEILKEMWGAATFEADLKQERAKYLKETGKHHG